MLNLYEFLTQNKDYTEDEAEETVLRWDCCMDLPEKIHKDIDDYYKYRWSVLFPKAIKGA